MKFGKSLDIALEDMPCEWRPYVIQYKSLKKCINKIVEELEARGLPADLLTEWLRKNEANDANHNQLRKLDYFLQGTNDILHPYIRITLDGDRDPNLPLTDIVDLMLTLPVAPIPLRDLRKTRLSISSTNSTNSTDSTDSTDSSHSDRSYTAPPSTPTEFHNSYIPQPAIPVEIYFGNTDFFTYHSVAPSPRGSVAATPSEPSHASVDLRDDDAPHAPTPHGKSDPNAISVMRDPTHRSVVIELESDSEFLNMLAEELTKLSELQEESRGKLEDRIELLEKEMIIATSPYKSDMYTWREIIKLYADAEILQGFHEADRTTRSVEASKTQLALFLNQMSKTKLVRRLSTKQSRAAFEQFVLLNTNLINIKQFMVLNRTAITKILKKHDKRSGLIASAGFPKLMCQKRFFTENLSKMLYYIVSSKLTSIVPQPDDYACPVCLAVAWRPIRLNCSHVFCVRCLVKAQRKGMRNCPMCRSENVVARADAGNLDVSLENFMKLYFPKEIKEKRNETEREQAMEDMEAITGRQWTNRAKPADADCAIM